MDSTSCNAASTDHSTLHAHTLVWRLLTGETIVTKNSLQQEYMKITMHNILIISQMYLIGEQHG